MEDGERRWRGARNGIALGQRLGYRNGHRGRLDHANKYRQESWNLWRNVVGALVVCLAMLQAEAVVLPGVLRRALRHLWTGLRHTGHLGHFSGLTDRKTLTRAGVRSRGQLYGQKSQSEEAGQPEPAR